MAKQLEVASCPSQDLTFTNLLYCSSEDLSSVGNEIEIRELVYAIEVHKEIKKGQVGLNAIQRKSLRVEKGDKVNVRPFNSPSERFESVIMYLEIEPTKQLRKAQVDAKQFARELKHLESQVFTVGQKFAVSHDNAAFYVTLTGLVNAGQSDEETSHRGRLTKTTEVELETSENANMRLTNQKRAAAPKLFKEGDFNFEKLGIGGLDKQFRDIFRRAFASRVFPPNVVSRLGIEHVKGMLLHGPPGTGKTLIARQIGKLLNGKEPKVVNGPELLNKYVGQSEENLRNLFKDAESELAKNGDESDLHVIIFDEIDAICKSRGGGKSDAGVGESMVNQLLTKIDGVHALPNILLIGMTNRKDLLDEALLRPGRLEVQIEIGLPDKEGRLQILNIHTSKMASNEFLGNDVDLASIAEKMKNFSGAEIEGVVKSATSFALSRKVDVTDLNSHIDEENLKVTMVDFQEALNEVQPAFGASVDALERCRTNGIIHYGERLDHIKRTCNSIVEQTRSSANTSLMSCLLEGVPGSGKTALASSVALESAFPFMKFFSAENLIGMGESERTNQLSKVFEDAYKSPLSVIILDDIERLVEYARIGPRFSNVIMQAIMVLLKRLPPKGHRLLVVGTTSAREEMSALGLADAFDVNVNVPGLSVDEARSVLSHLGAMDEKDLDEATNALGEGIPIKKLLMLVEVAKSNAEGGRVPIDLFLNAVTDVMG